MTVFYDSASSNFCFNSSCLEEFYWSYWELSNACCSFSCNSWRVLSASSSLAFISFYSFCPFLTFYSRSVSYSPCSCSISSICSWREERFSYAFFSFFWCSSTSFFEVSTVFLQEGYTRFLLVGGLLMVLSKFLLFFCFLGLLVGDFLLLIDLLLRKVFVFLEGLKFLV